MSLFKRLNLIYLFKYYFLISILLVTLLPLLVVVYLTTTISQEILEKQLIKKLAVLADYNEELIDRFISSLEGEFKILTHVSSIIQFVLLSEEKIPSEKTKEELQKFKDFLKNFIPFLIDNTHYEKLYLFNKEDELIFSFPENSKNIDNNYTKNILNKTINNSKILMDTALSNFVPAEESGHDYGVAFIASPIIFDKNIIGTLVAEFNDEKIKEIVEDNSDIGTTGEIIVGKWINNKIKLMMPLRYQNDAELPKGSETEYYLKQAAVGREGEGLFTDYRGEQVLAAWRYVPVFQWGLLVKQDAKIVLSPVLELRKKIIILSCISLLLVGLIANFVSNKLQQTENFLTHIINSISSLLVIINSSKKIVRWNQAAEKILNLKEKEIKNKQLIDIFPYLSPYLNKIEQAITENRLEKIDRIALENQKYASVVIYPLIQKKFTGAVILIEDITERVKLMENIVQTDKLASVGVLTAGIAHEINNPVNFISSSIPPLKRDIADVLTILNQYFELDPESPSKEKLTQIKKLREELDVDYTLEEINKLVDGMQDGAERTTTIVKDLRTFSRLDEAEMKMVNVHEGIDSTLTLLKNKYKHKAIIQKEYGNIPEIEGHPGKLNQVFMNILANAIDAIPEKGEIIIKTYLADDQHVAISIKDTGIGMTEAVKAKIFEPFFTTKEIGAGTGLGLAITYGIIRDHKGEIQVHSEPGKGTQFIVIFPIHQI